MKKILSVSVFVLFSILQAYSCDPLVFSFCESSIDLPNEKIFIGKITNQFDHGVELEIILTLRGEEQNNTITVWDGIDIDCNGIFSMTISGYGEIGDTVICIVQFIDTIENNWEVLGSYRRPSSINYTTYLNIVDGIVWNYNLSELVSYQNFLDSWTNNECSIILSTQNTGKPPVEFFPNPVMEDLWITSDSYFLKSYKISSINGQVLQTGTLMEKPYLIKTNKLKAGMFLLQTIDYRGSASSSIFVKI